MLDLLFSESAELFRYFLEISAIPRPSGGEQAIAAHLMDFGREHGLECHRDEAGNVILIREASKGCEEAPALILQAHMDMVCEREEDCDRDLTKEPPELMVEGDYITARGTTLGGDDGIGVACCMTLLADPALLCPRLECVFTTEEETGMDGARELDVSFLTGRQLINIDSEEEGVLLASCAGGGRLEVSLPLERDGTIRSLLLVSLSGLTGGHSGGEIHKGRANAVCALAQLLGEVFLETDFSLVSLSGGEKDNAIPRSARAWIDVREEDRTLLVQKLEALASGLLKQQRLADPELIFSVEEIAASEESFLPMTPASTQKALALVAALPNGVVRFSDEIEGLVETSLNLGITRTQKERLCLSYAPRSSVSSAFEALCARMRLVASAFGAECRLESAYPAWEYRPDSPLRETLCRVWEEQTGKPMQVAAIHAGLECGLLCERLPGLDAVSVGPELLDVHTPAERLSIASSCRVLSFLRESVQQLARLFPLD